LAQTSEWLKIGTCFLPEKHQEVERTHILGVLGKTGWRVSGNSGAAQILGLKPTTLEAHMKKLGIKRPA
jgi:transcriptional regulator with GAF, ATPase, and Fis domain